jgi:hypothetical protein
VAVALDADGHFRIDPNVTPGPEGVPIVSAARARELAAAFAHSYGPAFVRFWEEDRGDAIDLPSLTVGARVYPAQTAFDAVPDIGCHSAIVRLFGSYYLLTLNRGPQAQVRMAVSAQTTEYSVDTGGGLVQPSRTGEDFIHDGIPARGAYVVSPEQAVALVARATGARVNRAPRLVLRSNNKFSPTFALWRVDLDRAVTVHRGTGQSASVTTIYAGPNAMFYVPSTDQPASVTQICPKIDANLVDHGIDAVTVRVLSQPVDFESVLVSLP